MRIVLAPHLEVDFRPRAFAAEVLEKYPSALVADDSQAIVDEVVREAIQRTEEALHDDVELDAPPFTASSWWVATVERQDGNVTVHSFEPVHFYAIEENARVRFERSLANLRVAELARALSEGHYPSTESTLVITRSGEFGGNGASVASLLGWLWDFAPEVLFALGVERGLSWHRARKDRRIRRLAEDWASGNIHHPRYLRRFVETKRRWFPSILADRLSLSEAAARRLLASLGYEPGADDAMELRISPEAMRSRDTWIYGESWPHHEVFSEDDIADE